MRDVRPIAVLVAVMLALTGFGIPGPALAQQPTSISIRAENGAVVAGGTATIVGFLFVPDAAASGRPVELEARATGEADFLPVAEAVTSTSGKVRVDVQPAVTTRYRLRYAGAEDAAPATSAVVVVRVRTVASPGRRSPTSMSIRAVKPAVLPGAATTLRGRLRGEPQAGLGHRRVVLLAKSAGAGVWQFHYARRTDRAGQVHFLIRPRTHTQYRFTFAGTAAYRPTRSGVVDVQMRPVVTIAADPVLLDPGESTSITGTVTAETGPLVGATVDLLAREVGSGASWLMVASTTTAADGSVSLLAAPTVTTAYRLRSNATGDVPAGRSGSVRVAIRSASALAIRGATAPEGFVITGRLVADADPVRNAEVTLQTYDATTATWRDVVSGLTNARGRVRFVRPITPGASYRLVYDGPEFASSTSATLTA
ncbi:hypothetical protein GON03_03630 [Nocardioides sp. MAH-18]|uniref:Uncharacterized protein n=1 Tax=Nocardioides agri TaxID=2682843 RepID=A0A6L6XLY7_9ACTN|nr:MULTISPECIES: hypothetical protein [unclassified Nocardioides]MBA2953391.1 hypothetical protein [Nocardioides sp. CGMCC 1.13656]MVQ48259.1 hypothetical protein [Nocardioides sp. MAH-18]